MKKLLFAVALALLATPALAATAPIQLFCEDGGKTVTLSGLSSTTTVQQSYPSCTVTVYLTGTTTLATIYADKNNTALSNPFTSRTDGFFIFWATIGTGLDVVNTGGTSPNTFATAFTYTDLVPGGGSGGTGITSVTVNTSNANLLSVATSGTSTAPVFLLTPLVVPQGLGQPQYSGVQATSPLLANPWEFFNTSLSGTTSGDISSTVQTDLNTIGCLVHAGTVPSAIYHLPTNQGATVHLNSVYVPTGIVVQPPGYGATTSNGASAVLPVVQNNYTISGSATKTSGKPTFQTSASYAATCSGTSTTLGGQGVTIRGYTIAGAGTTGGADVGILFNDAYDVAENDYIYNTGGPAIELQAASDSAIRVNTYDSLIYASTDVGGNYSDFVGAIDVTGTSDTVTGGNVQVNTTYLSSLGDIYPYDVGVHLGGSGNSVTGTTVADSDVGFGIEGTNQRVTNTVSNRSADAAYWNYGSQSVFTSNQALGPCQVQNQSTTYNASATPAWHVCIVYNDTQWIPVVGGGTAQGIGTGAYNTWTDNLAQCGVASNCASSPVSYIGASFGDFLFDSWTGNIPANYPATTDTSGNNLSYTQVTGTNAANNGGYTGGFQPVPHICNVASGAATAPNCSGSSLVIFNDASSTVVTGLQGMGQWPVWMQSSTANDFIDSNTGGGTSTNQNLPAGISYQAPKICNSYGLQLSTSPLYFPGGGLVSQACQANDWPQLIVNGLKGYQSPTTYTNNNNLFMTFGDAHVYRISTPAAPGLTTSGSTTGSVTYGYRIKYVYGAHTVVTAASDNTTTLVPGGSGNSVGIYINGTRGYSAAYVYRNIVSGSGALTAGVICTYTTLQASGAACIDTGAAASGSVPTNGFNDTGSIAVDTYTPADGACAEIGATYIDNTYIYHCGSDNIMRRLGSFTTF